VTEPAVETISVNKEEFMKFMRQSIVGNAGIGQAARSAYRRMTGEEWS